MLEILGREGQRKENGSEFGQRENMWDTKCKAYNSKEFSQLNQRKDNHVDEVNLATFTERGNYQITRFIKIKISQHQKVSTKADLSVKKRQCNHALISTW